MHGGNATYASSAFVKAGLVAILYSGVDSCLDVIVVTENSFRAF